MNGVEKKAVPAERWRGRSFIKGLEALLRERKSQAKTLCQLRDTTSFIFWDHTMGGTIELKRQQEDKLRCYVSSPVVSKIDLLHTFCNNF